MASYDTYRQQIIDHLEAEHSKAMADTIAQLIVENETAFAAGVSVLREGDAKQRQRMAWPFSKAWEIREELYEPYYGQIVDWLPEAGHDAERRCFVRILAHAPLPVEKLGELFEAAFQWLSDPQAATAVRVWSMDICTRIAEMEPDLKREVALAIREAMVHGSKGMQSRGRKMLKRLEK